nr:hypothetical protein [Tanacetum cinerariifolium]
CGQPYEYPSRGGFCLFCASNSKISFNPNPNSFDDSQNFSDYSPQPQFEIYQCKLCGNDSHHGYDCTPRFPFVYEHEPCYNQNYNENYYPHNSPSFLCCDNGESFHENFQNESMNQNFFEPNLCYEPNSSSFDQYHSSQYSVTPQLPQRSNEDFLNDLRTIEQAANLAVQQEQKEQADYEEMLQDREKFMQDTQIFLENFNRFSFGVTPRVLSIAWERIDKIKYVLTEPEEIPELMCKLLEDVRNIKEELAEYIDSPSWNSPTFFYDDDEESSIQYKEYLEKFPDAVTTVLPIKEPEYSLSMGYEHLSITPETESDEVTDDDESLSDEDVPIEEFKVYSNPLFDDEEIHSDKLDLHCFNAKSDFVESLSNRDTLIDSSLKFDYLEEFFGALLPTSIADEECIRREHAKYISLMERLFTINPCPRSMENSNAIIETLSTSLIPLEENDSQREEIDIFTGTDELLPPSIESDDYDSEGEIHVLKELLVDDSISLLEN